MRITHATTAGEYLFVDLSVLVAENEAQWHLLLALTRGWIRNFGITQKDVADSIGVKQHVMNETLNGIFLWFTVGWMVRTQVAVWLHMNMTRAT